MATKMASIKQYHRPQYCNNLMWKLFLCFGFFVAVVNGSAPGACNEGCPNTQKSGNLVFVPGNVYTYDLSSEMTVYLAGNDAQETSIKVQGQAQLYADKNCQYALRLNRIIVFGPDHKKNQLGNELQLSKIVRFTMANDELTTDICAEQGDTGYSLNFKRAIISMLQSAGTKRTETDVFGICPTTFATTRTDDQTLIVTKVRNLNTCGYRESLATGLITGIFDEQSDIKTTPVLNGDYSCEQRIKNGIPQNIQTNEEYQFIPFASGEAGARAKVVTKLHLKGQQSGEAPKQASVHVESILFDNPHEQPMVNNVNNVKNALKQAIGNYQNGVGAKAAGQFVELIRLMRFTKKDDLLALYQQVKAGTVHAGEKELARKIYFDALFRCGTGESVQVIGQLLRNEMSEREQHLAYLSLNLVKSIDDPALASINKILDGNPPREAYLSVGNLVSKYCRDHHGCESNEIKSISEKFVTKLGDCRGDTRKKENNVVAVLKGIRNTNNLISSAVERVVQCTGDKYTSRIRVSAIQALAAGACHKKVQSTALTILKNRAEDAELRIEAYLVLVACPSGQIANELKALLDTETVYQVGAFITSHLANLRSSTDLHRELARQHFAHIRTVQKFPSDIRRYSFNQELSYALPSLGMGASADATVIYSQREFLPRSTRFNLTGEIFGSSFNILELAARQENFDLVLEHYFGPKGLLQSNGGNWQNVYDTFFGSSSSGDSGDGKGEKRKMRSIRDDVTQFSKQVDMDDNETALKDIDYDLSVKLFGTEMYFLSLADDPMTIEPGDFIKKFKTIIDRAMTDASGKGIDYKFENHALFLDADLVYPTGVGLPLKLTVQGTSVLRVDVNGQLNIRKIINDPKNMKFTLKLMPSYNIEITGALSVDGYAVSTGIEVSGAVHSSTGAEFDFALSKDAHNMDVNIRLPFKKQELLTLDHKIVFITQERGQETVTNNLKFTTKKDEFTACFDQFSRYIGVTFCAEASVTGLATPGVALFPLNGGNRLSAWLEMDQAYAFTMVYDNSDSQRLKLHFDTPGSEVARTTNVEFQAKWQPKPYGRIDIDSPHRKGSIEVGYANDNQEMVFYMNAINNAENYHGKIGFSKTGQLPHEKYTPIIIFQTPNKQDNNVFGYKMTGDITVDSTKSPTIRYQFNSIKIVNMMDNSGGIGGIKPLTLNGWIDTTGPTKIATDLHVKQDGGSQEIGIIGSIEYSLYNAIHFDFGLTCNFFEHANGKLKFDIEQMEKNFKSNVLFVYGTDFSSTTKRFELTQDYTIDLDESSKRLQMIKFANKLNAPFLPFNLRVDGEYQQKLIKYLVELGYGKNKLASNMDGKFDGRTEGDYDVTIGISINQHNVKVLAKRDIDTVAGRSKLTNKLTCSMGTRIELNGLISNRPTLTDADINLDGLLIVTDKSEPYKLTFILLLQSEKSNSNGKLMHGNSELATYTVKMQRTGSAVDGITSHNGVIQFAVKNIVNGNGEFKSNGGKGDAWLMVNIERVERKMKIDSKFNVAAPVYEWNSDFYYDYERDNNKRISIETKNHISKTHFGTDNTLDLGGEKYELNAVTDRHGTLENGKLNGKILLKLPSTHEFGIDFEREMAINGKGTTNNMANGKSNIKFTERIPSMQKSRSLTIDSKLNDANLKAKLFDLFMKMEYVDFDGRTLIFDTNFKHLPNGHYKTATATVTARGTLLSEVIDVVISADEYCPEHAVYRIVAKYGGKMNTNINGDYYVGARGKPGTYDITAIINMPNTKIKAIRFQSNAKLLVPQTDDGLYEGQFKVTASLDEKTLSIDTTGKGNGKHGTGNIKVNLPNVDPIAADATYSLNVGGGDGVTNSYDDIQATLLFNCQYGSGKAVSLSSDYKRMNGRESIFHATLKTPSGDDGTKTLDLSYHGIRKDENSFTIDSTIKVDDHLYGLLSDIGITPENALIDITLRYPTDKITKFYATSKRIDDGKYTSKLAIENFADFNAIATSNVNIQSIDTFSMNVDIDAPKLNLNKVHIEINAKQNAAAKGVEFKAMTGDKNILSGFAEYTIKEEKGKTLIEGQGNVKIYDKQKPASFKLLRNVYNEMKDGERGVHISFSGLLGTQNIVLDTHLTNKMFHIRQTVCEEKNQCINFEVKSLIKQNPPNEFKHELLVAVDLRKFGYAYEFGLQSDTERSGLTMFKHNFDMHLQAQDKTKYEYRTWIDNKRAGIQLTIPSRVMAIEANYQIPKELFGHYDIGVSSYLDKQGKPQSKATVSIVIDLTRPGKNIVNNRGELKFTHPLMRELKIIGETNFNGDTQTASGRLELDLFQQADQAIVIAGKYGNSEPTTMTTMKSFNVSSEFSVHSHGLQFEYSFTGHAAASMDRREISAGAAIVSPFPDLRMAIFLLNSDEQLEFIVTAFNENLITINGKFDTNKMNADFKSKVQMIGSTMPILIDCTVQGFTAFLLHVERNHLIKFNGEFSVGKEASLLLIDDAAKKDLFRARVALDQTHFLTSEYKINDGDFKEFIKMAQNEIKADTERARASLGDRVQKAKTSLDGQFVRLKASIIDFEPIKGEYKMEYDKLVDELLADKTIKEFVNFFMRIYGTIGKTLVDIIKVLIDNTNKILDIFKEFYRKLLDAFKDKILPAIRETFERFEHIIPQIYQDTVRLIGDIFERIAKALKVFESDFEKFGKLLSDAFKQFAQAFAKYFEIVRKEVYDLYGFITTNIKELPGFQYAKEKFHEVFGSLIVPESLINVLKEVTNTLKDTLPTAELDDFAQNLSNYIENKIANKPVNDMEELKNLYVSLVKAIKSIVDLIRNQAGQLNTDNLSIPAIQAIGPIPLSLAALKRLPQLSSVRFSLWNYLRHENTPTLRDLILTYRPYAFDPLNIVPPFAKRSTIINGQHVLTFDGRYITLPGGQCTYIFAQDFHNGNFSLIGQLNENGQMKSITLLDKGDFIEWTADGVINLNGKQTDLPIHHGTIHAWRNFYAIILYTDYGVHVICSNDLKLCRITVNGYYHNQMRGLLGNANNEPNDDLQLPNGKLADGFYNFANAYKAQKSCATLPLTDKQHIQHSDVCTRTFGWESSLRYCYYFIDSSLYREACDYAVAVETATTNNPPTHDSPIVCDFARAYSIACNAEKIPISMPKSCGKCGDGKYDINQQYESIAPQKKADIVIVVDTDIGGQLLNEFVQPLIGDLRKELRSRDIGDIKIIVIGYNANDKYLTQFTTNGQLDFTGKFNIAKLDESPKISKPLKTDNEQLNKYLTAAHNHLHRIENDLGLGADARAFHEAMSYPFRSTAGNVIIAIRPDQLEYSPNPIKLFGAIFSNAFAQLSGTSVHVIAPVSDLSLTKDTKNTRNIVGFSGDAVVLLSDHKKRGTLGSVDLRKNLNMNSDMGVDLVLDGAGYVFPLNNYQQLKNPKEKKQFIGTVASTLAEHTSRTEVKYDCVCTLKFGVLPDEVCIAINTNILPVQKKNVPQRG